MGKKKKFKEEEEIGKDYQYLVTWQITLDYKDNKTYPVNYLKLFDKKEQAISYIGKLIDDNIFDYEKERVEMHERKDLSDATVIKWHKKKTDIIWTWVYEILKIEHAVFAEIDREG